MLQHESLTGVAAISCAKMCIRAAQHPCRHGPSHLSLSSFSHPVQTKSKKLSQQSRKPCRCRGSGSPYPIPAAAQGQIGQFPTQKAAAKTAEDAVVCQTLLCYLPGKAAEALAIRLRSAC